MPREAVGTARGERCQLGVMESRGAARLPASPGCGGLRGAPGADPDPLPGSRWLCWPRELLRSWG